MMYEVEDEDEKFECSCQMQFHGIEYLVSIKMENNDDGQEELLIEVEDLSSSDIWKAKFDGSYIEDLTHKTGNFKQFNIFCSMLESAVSQTSESVNLDLLTYSDLEALREQKVGKQKRFTNQQNSNLNSKRYLIMTYTVEFDRIHYPLPLPYAGRHDSVSLRRTIQNLRDEIRELKKQSKRGPNASDTLRLNQQLQSVMEERDLLVTELEQNRRDMQSISKGTIAKEIKVMRKVVQNLETDLMKERNKYKRMIAKKTQEFEELSEQFQQLKANERNLRVRCKSLADELSMMKRAAKFSPVPTNPPRNHTTRTSRSRERSRERPSYGSGSGRPSRTPSPSYGRFDPTAYIKEKKRRQQEISSSQKRRRTPTQQQIRSRQRSLSSERKYTPVNNRPAVQRPPSSKRAIKSKGDTRSNRSRPQRSSSIGSIDSNRSLYSDDDRGSYTSGRRGRNSSRLSQESQKQRGIRSRLNVFSGSELSDGDENLPPKQNRKQSSHKMSAKKSRASKKQLESTKQSSSPQNPNQSIGIADIDARLEALQRFMRANLQDTQEL